MYRTTCFARNVTSSLPLKVRFRSHCTLERSKPLLIRPAPQDHLRRWSSGAVQKSTSWTTLSVLTHLRTALEERVLVRPLWMRTGSKTVLKGSPVSTDKETSEKHNWNCFQEIVRLSKFRCSLNLRHHVKTTLIPDLDLISGLTCTVILYIVLVFTPWFAYLRSASTMYRSLSTCLSVSFSKQVTNPSKPLKSRKNINIS